MTPEWSFLEELNLTELAAMAASQDTNSHRGLSREVLYSVIMGEHPPLPPFRMDLWRQAIFLFVDAHWNQVSPLLSCPMKSRQPYACFQCGDVQVAECVSQNRGIIMDARNLIRAKEKSK